MVNCIAIHDDDEEEVKSAHTGCVSLCLLSFGLSAHETWIGRSKSKILCHLEARCSNTHVFGVAALQFETAAMHVSQNRKLVLRVLKYRRFQKCAFVNSLKRSNELKSFEHNEPDYRF